MKIAVTLCAALGGLFTTALGLYSLHEVASGSIAFPAVLSWWLAMGWVVALLGLVLFFDRGGLAGTVTFGLHPVMAIVLALPEQRRVLGSLLVCGFFSLAAVLSLFVPAVRRDEVLPGPAPAKPHPLLWIGGGLAVSALLLGGLLIEIERRIHTAEASLARQTRELSRFGSIPSEVEAFKQKTRLRDRKASLIAQASRARTSVIASLYVVRECGLHAATVKATRIRDGELTMKLSAPSLAAAMKVVSWLRRTPGVSEVKLGWDQNGDPDPRLTAYSIQGKIETVKVAADLQAQNPEQAQ